MGSVAEFEEVLQAWRCGANQSGRKPGRCPTGLERGGGAETTQEAGAGQASAQAAPASPRRRQGGAARGPRARGRLRRCNGSGCAGRPGQRRAHARTGAILVAGHGGDSILKRARRPGWQRQCSCARARITEGGSGGGRGGGGGGGRSGGGGGGYESAAGGDMANIAVQRIKREFKEVLKSEEVRNELPDIPHLVPGREGPTGGDSQCRREPPSGPPRGRPSACGEAAVFPSPSATFPSPPRALGWTVSRAVGVERSTVSGGGEGAGALGGV